MELHPRSSDKDVTIMPHVWPDDTDFAFMELDVIDRACPGCGRMMYVCDHRYRHLYTLEGPVELICRLNHCPDPLCPGHAKTKSPETEIFLAMPGWAIGWDVFCWIGHRRFSRHWSVPQIHGELKDSFGIFLSENGVANYVRRYQTMVAARQQDLALLRQAYEGVDSLVLWIDGLQPEKGHETLYVVRELNAKRVWFGEPLLSSSEEEVRRLIVQAKQWADTLGKPVKLWISDKQDAFLKGIAAEFPQVPHRYCSNHFLRDLAKPFLDADSRAKVEMRSKVRGLRNTEQAVLKRRRQSLGKELEAPSQLPTESQEVGSLEARPAVAEVDAAGEIVLSYCAAVRGILNDDQGGPINPPGLRMAEALGEVRESIQRNLDTKKGGSQKRNSTDWPAASTGDWKPSKAHRRQFDHL
jgi:hypothetical protein